MKKKLFLVIMLLSITFSTASALVKVYPTYAESGAEAELFVVVQNPTSRGWDDVQVILYIPELNIFKTTSSFDVHGKDAVTKIFMVDIPRHASGYVVLRAFVFGDDVRIKDSSYLAII